jgi:hypothetical protein
MKYDLDYLNEALHTIVRGLDNFRLLLTAFDARLQSIETKLAALEYTVRNPPPPAIIIFPQPQPTEITTPNPMPPNPIIWCGTTTNPNEQLN